MDLRKWLKLWKITSRQAVRQLGYIWMLTFSSASYCHPNMMIRFWILAQSHDKNELKKWKCWQKLGVHKLWLCTVPLLQQTVNNFTNSLCFPCYCSFCSKWKHSLLYCSQSTVGALSMLGRLDMTALKLLAKDFLLWVCSVLELLKFWLPHCLFKQQVLGIFFVVFVCLFLWQYNALVLQKELVREKKAVWIGYKTGTKHLDIFEYFPTFYFPPKKTHNCT